MSATRMHGAGWLGLVAVLAVTALLGWYVGHRIGGDASVASSPPVREHSNSGVYRDIAGRVVRVSAGDGVLTVDHEAIEGFMAAMTMDLQVAEPAELRGLKSDDAIRFDLARIGDTYMAVRIRPASDDATASPAAHEPPVQTLGRGDLVPNLALFDTSGQPFHLHDMKPRHKLITFFYARCPLETFCPAQSRRLAELQAHLEANDSDVHLVSLTLDAEHDGAAVLAGYAEQFEVIPGRWTLAGGDDPDAIRAFADRVGGRIYKHDDGFKIDHALVALRVDGNRIVDFVYGLDAIEELVHGM